MDHIVSCMSLIWWVHVGVSVFRRLRYTFFEHCLKLYLIWITESLPQNVTRVGVGPGGCDSISLRLPIMGYPSPKEIWGKLPEFIFPDANLPNDFADGRNYSLHVAFSWYVPARDTAYPIFLFSSIEQGRSIKLWEILEPRASALYSAHC